MRACARVLPCLILSWRFSDESAGCYVVRFYKDGKNVDVGIDDFFPLAFGTKPLFADSGTREKVPQDRVGLLCCQL